MAKACVGWVKSYNFMFVMLSINNIVIAIRFLSTHTQHSTLWIEKLKSFIYIYFIFGWDTKPQNPLVVATAQLSLSNRVLCYFQILFNDYNWASASAFVCCIFTIYIYTHAYACIGCLWIFNIIIILIKWCWERMLPPPTVSSPKFKKQPERFVMSEENCHRHRQQK